MTDAQLVTRPLESDLFGVSIAGVSVRRADDVEPVLDAIRMASFDLIVLRLPAAAIDAAQALEGHGARLCDVLVSLSGTIPMGGLSGASSDGGLAIRAGRADDAAAMRAVALEAFDGFSGHWHADSRLDAARATELYARWAGDLARRPAALGSVLIAESPVGEVAGFLALEQDSPADWHVPLTAVHPRFRGRGTLRDMLGAASTTIAAHGSVRFRYDTQLTNWPAMRVVSRCGFIPGEAQMTFHLWTVDL